MRNFYKNSTFLINRDLFWCISWLNWEHNSSERYLKKYKKHANVTVTTVHHAISFLFLTHSSCSSSRCIVSIRSSRQLFVSCATISNCCTAVRNFYRLVSNVSSVWCLVAGFPSTFTCSLKSFIFVFHIIYLKIFMHLSEKI